VSARLVNDLKAALQFIHSITRWDATAGKPWSIGWDEHMGWLYAREKHSEFSEALWQGENSSRYLWRGGGCRLGVGY